MSDTAEFQTKVAVLEEIARSTKDALGRIERRMDALDKRVDDGLREVRSAQHTQLYWTLGVTLGGFAGLLGAMARGFGWLSH